jgi:hypothetical protein
VFGGSNGDEGLGLLSICFDWQVSVNTNFEVDRVTDWICDNIFLARWTLWLSRLKHRYDLFLNPRVRSLTYFLNSSRICWATFFARAITPPWFGTLHWFMSRVVFVAVYYNNIWKAQNFPFVSLHSCATAQHWCQLPTGFSTFILWKGNTVRTNTHSQFQLWKSIPHSLLNKDYLIIPALG